MHINIYILFQCYDYLQCRNVCSYNINEIHFIEQHVSCASLCTCREIILYSIRLTPIFNSRDMSVFYLCLYTFLHFFLAFKTES